MVSLVNSTKHLRKKLYQSSTVFQKIEQRECFLTHSVRPALP